MRKASKRRIKSSPATLSRSSGRWIILLLCILLILSAADLYFDHFAVQRPAVMPGRHAEESSDSVAETTSAEVIPVPVLETQPVSTPPPVLPAPSQIRVQVLNGCGVQGLARRTRNTLRRWGFDVISFGNAGRQDYSQSQVIARAELPFGELAARVVADSLRVKTDQIQIKRDPRLVDIDVTVVVGFDYRQLNLKTE